jgi:hypothetical protein
VGLNTHFVIVLVEMEWLLPIQKMEVAKVHIGGLNRGIKLMAPLAYMDGSFCMPHLNLLLPPLTVKEYDPHTGKLLIQISDSLLTSSKLLALQETLLGAVYLQQRNWFSTSFRTPDEIRTYFQPFLDRDVLHLYCPMIVQEKKAPGAGQIEIWKQNIWHKGVKPGLLQKGDFVRIALRLQGLSFQSQNGTSEWTGRFRIQHKIISILHCS